MIIRVTGTKFVKYTNKNNNSVEGFEIHGVIVEPDEEDKNVNGCLTFAEFFNNANLESVPFEGQEYRVIFSMRKFNGSYQAYPHHLESV